MENSLDLSELDGPSKAFDDEDVDDMFEFTDTLRLSDEEGNGAGPSEENEKLPPLPDDTEDVFGDRGVLIKRVKPPADPQSPYPSKSRRYVELHYEGFVVETGKKFDTTRDQNYPLIALLDIPPSGNSTLIRAWEVALQKVRAGETMVLTAASRYAYGAEGVAPDIPPHSDLRFEIEVLDVRSTHKRVVVVDHSKEDLSRLEEVRREREIAQQRRLEEQQIKDAEKKAKAEKAEAIKQKLAAKQTGGGKKKKAGKK